MMNKQHGNNKATEKPESLTKIFLSSTADSYSSVIRQLKASDITANNIAVTSFPTPRI